MNLFIGISDLATTVLYGDTTYRSSTIILLYLDRSTSFVRYTPPFTSDNVAINSSVRLSKWSNLLFSVVDQKAGAATRAPERSPHGLHKV